MSGFRLRLDHALRPIRYAGANVLGGLPCVNDHANSKQVKSCAVEHRYRTPDAENQNVS